LFQVWKSIKGLISTVFRNIQSKPFTYIKDIMNLSTAIKQMCPTSLPLPNFRTLKLLGAGVHRGQKHIGVRAAPHLIVEQGGLYKKLYNSNEFAGIDIEYLGDTTPRRVMRACVDHQEDFTLVLGGDHSLSRGSVHAASIRNPGIAVVIVDAHADLNTPESSPSGNSHGMWVRTLLERKHIQPRDVFYLGLRDLDPAETQFLDKSDINFFTMDTIRRVGIESVMDELQWRLDHTSRTGYHLSFDIDAITPELAPSTGTPVGAGLDIFDVTYMCNFMRDVWGDRFRSMDLVEVNPLIGTGDDCQKTIRMATHVITSSLIGETRFRYHRKREDTIRFKF